MNRKNLILTMDSPLRFEIVAKDAVFTPLTEIPGIQNNPNPMDKRWWNYVPLERVDLFQRDKDGYFPLCWNVKFTVPKRKNTGHFRFKVKIRQNLWFNRKLGQTKFVKVYGLEDLYKFDENGNKLNIPGGKPAFDRCWNLMDDSCEAVSEGTHQLLGGHTRAQGMYPGSYQQQMHAGAQAAAPLQQLAETGGERVSPFSNHAAMTAATAGAAGAAGIAGAAALAGHRRSQQQEQQQEQVQQQQEQADRYDVGQTLDAADVVNMAEETPRSSLILEDVTPRTRAVPNPTREDLRSSAARGSAYRDHGYPPRAGANLD